ncbi:hypothetical protein [Halomonas kalidii]|uniref:Uncharacterized protein n=1 Tax=Halomonas kalidii TaxID=3043293 RepID=A0ABT6VKG6_9GAMM|nr:hypothetical protein [Halomonas kalidii]MDI5933752.1 hypothetical protein [Halomonas kalidii]
MRKRNSLSYVTVMSLFNADAESEKGGSYFRVNGGKSPVTIDVPASIMHRLFRLGQAYGFRQLRYFESDVKLVVGSIEVPEFVRDLEKLHKLLNDEVLHQYIDELLIELKRISENSSPSIAVFTGSYYERRS